MVNDDIVPIVDALYLIFVEQTEILNNHPGDTRTMEKSLEQTKKFVANCFSIAELTEKLVSLVGDVAAYEIVRIAYIDTLPSQKP